MDTMSRILSSLTAIQINLAQIDSHFDSIVNDDTYDIEALNVTEAILKKYHENVVLARRVDLLEKKVTMMNNSTETTPTTPAMPMN